MSEEKHDYRFGDEELAELRDALRRSHIETDDFSGLVLQLEALVESERDFLVRGLLTPGLADIRKALGAAVSAIEKATSKLDAASTIHDDLLRPLVGDDWREPLSDVHQRLSGWLDNAPPTRGATVDLHRDFFAVKILIVLEGLGIPITGHIDGAAARTLILCEHAVYGGGGDDPRGRLPRLRAAVAARTTPPAQCSALEFLAIRYDPPK